MKVAVVSDTHGRMGWEIPECDVFVHAGDITAGGSLEETKDFADWLKTQRQIGMSIIVPGNHDKCFAEEIPAVKRLFDDDLVTILIDRSFTFGGKTFHGSAFTPTFGHWWFMSSEEGLAERYKRMPQELNMLITHGPPYGFLDPGWREEHAGSKALREAVMHRDIRNHVFGHLHGAGGGSALLMGGETGSIIQTTFYNVAACDAAYNLVRQPIIIEL